MTIKKYAGDKITGLASDTKPTNVPDGATFYELDTGKVYRRQSSAWAEIDNTKANNAYNQSNTALISIASAFEKANAALANTSNITFGGNLNVSGNLTANVLASSNGYIDLGPGNRPPYVEGRIYYDHIDKSLTVYNNTTDFALPIGQKEFVKVLNDTASTLFKGQAVYPTGFHATSHHHLTVDLADASDSTKYDVLGLVASDIPAGEHGYVIVRGWLGGINTSSLTVSTRFHLGYSTPGSLVTTAPEYPNYPFDIGYCIVANNTNGFVYVDRQSHSFERLRVTSSARIGGDLTVEGDFNVLGSENQITVNSLEVGTQFIYLGAGDSIPNANVYFVGSGLNDIDFQGHYEGSGTTTFYVMISDVNPDKYSWSYTSNFSSLVQQNVAIQYQTSQPLSNGISVYFNANTGHTVGDKWNATAVGVSTDFGFVGNHIDGPNGYTHSGLFRDATDGTYKFFRSYDPEILGNIDIANNTFALANLQVDRITAAEVYEGATKLSSSIADAFIQAGAAFDKANSANVLAYNTGIGANAFAVSTFGAANNTPVGNTVGAAYTLRSTRRSLNFIPGSNITVNVDDDSAGDRANITITSTASGATVTLEADVVNATRYLVFANNITGNLVTANVSTGITFNPSSNAVTISGALNAITKSFVIDHPTKPDMKLRYGSLEGPENGVYVRGRVQGPYIYLPDYWSKLVDVNSITVSLTPIGKTKIPSVLSWNNDKIVLDAENPIDCFYHIYGERKDVDKLIVEY